METNAVWRRCMGYCVLVNADGMVEKFYAENETSPRMRTPKKPTSVGAFKAKVWRDRKKEARNGR